MTNNTFIANQIVPDVVAVAPPIQLTIKYGEREVNLGDEIRPSDTAKAPTVNYEADPQRYYTLMMVDPDAPTRRIPVFGQMQHWVVGNIPGNDVNKGDVVKEYLKCHPPLLTGLHRYVFLLFKQEDRIAAIDEAQNRCYVYRARFSTKEFCKKYRLGDPVAGNFFLARY